MFEQTMVHRGFRLIPFIIIVFLGGMVGLFSAFLGGPIESRSTTYLLVIFQSFIVFIPIISRILKREFDLAEPGMYFALYYFVHFGVRAVYDVLFGSPILGLAPGTNDLLIINVALGVSTIGIFVFWLGYHVKFGKTVAHILPKLPRRWNESSLKVAVILVVLGWIFRYLTIRYQAGSLMAWLKEDKYTLLAQAQGVTYLSILANLVTIGIMVIFVLARICKKRTLWFVFLFISIPEVLYLLVCGSRSQLIFFLLGLLMAHYMTSERGYRASLCYLRWMIVLALAAMFMFPFLSGLRGRGIFGINELLSQTLNYWRNPGLLLQMIGGRQHGLDSLAIVVAHVPEDEPYSLGKEIALLAVAWIPRQFWVDKPVISLGKVFYQKFFPSIYHEGTAVAVTFPAEFYWDFGLTGVMIGMFIIGIFWRVIFEYLVRSKDNLSNVLVTGIMFQSFFIPVEQCLVSFFTMHLVKFVLLAFIATILQKNSFKLNSCRLR